MKIAVIGKGNVGSHLFKAFKDKAEVALFDSRKPEEVPSDCQLIIICVKDDVIGEVAAKITNHSAVIVHTSGSVPMDILKPYAKNYGVLYPLQTFTRDIPLNYSEIPIFIEASDEETMQILNDAASLFTDNVKICNSERRKGLHLASVFACNFTNALVGISCDILGEYGFHQEDITPLIRQTIKKLNDISPAEAQTGPAKRNDIKVMATHKDMLKNQPELAKIYELLSEYIVRNK